MKKAVNPFDSVILEKPQSNSFDLSHSYTTPLNIGELTPIEVTEVLPGDSWYFSEEHYLKSAPMPSPVMNEFDYYVHYFFVPTRLVIPKGSEMFETGEDVESWRAPLLFAENATGYSAADYFLNGNTETSTLVGMFRTLAQLGYGERPAVTGSGAATVYPIVTSMIFDSYVKIYNDYYRNQFTQDEIPLCCNSVVTDGSPLVSVYNAVSDEDFKGAPWANGNLLCRNFKKDLFTTLLPDPVLYGEQINLNVTGVAKLSGFSSTFTNINFFNKADATTAAKTIFHLGSNETAPYGDFIGNSNSSDTHTVIHNAALDGIKFDHAVAKGAIYDFKNGEFTADTSIFNTINNASVSGLSIGTINELRTAFKLQEFLERSIIGGNRYIEQIYSHFGVMSDDARLQRPEFIGGGHSPVTITQINANNASADTQTLGTMAGHASSFGLSGDMSYFAKEHGYIIGIASIMPRNYYQITGMQRKYTRDSKLKYYWPKFAHLGMQEIKVDEFVGPSKLRVGVSAHEIVGYQDCYSEYKFEPSTVSRLLPVGLESWIWWNDFQTLADIECIPQDFGSIFAVESGSPQFDWQFILHSHQNIMVSREMPTYGTPML